MDSTTKYQLNSFFVAVADDVKKNRNNNWPVIIA